MDDSVPHLVGLLLAGAVALLSLRSHWGDTPGDRARFRVVLIVFLVIAALAVAALVRRGGEGVAPDPDAPTTVADLRRPAAPVAPGATYMDN
jgi:hypothetical protein